jgi:hypothetical protein
MPMGKLTRPSGRARSPNHDKNVGLLRNRGSAGSMQQPRRRQTDRIQTATQTVKQEHLRVNRVL